MVLLEKRQLLAFVFPTLIILSSIYLALSPLLKGNPDLVLGITYDLTLTAPLVYFFLIRKKKIPLLTVVPLFVLGTVLATFLLPKHQQAHLDLIKLYLLPVVELIFLSVISYQVYKVTKAFKAAPTENYDFYHILKESSIKAIGYPKIARIFASEIAMAYYAFFSWKKGHNAAKGFTNYKENGITALLAVILFILVVEISIVHILLIRWNETAAWIISLSSVYAAIQVFGHLKALKRRPSVLIGNQLFLKYGLFGDIKIDINNISRIELTAKNIEDRNRLVEKLALLKELESHNVVIYFTKKQKLEKAYGITRECDTLLLYIDNEKEFAQIINNALKQHL